MADCAARLALALLQVGVCRNQDLGCSATYTFDLDRFDGPVVA